MPSWACNVGTSMDGCVLTAVPWRTVKSARGDANLRGDGKHGGRAHNSLGRIPGGARTRVYTRRDGWTRELVPDPYGRHEACVRTHARTRDAVLCSQRPNRPFTSANIKRLIYYLRRAELVSRLLYASTPRRWRY